MEEYAFPFLRAGGYVRSQAHEKAYGEINGETWAGSAPAISEGEKKFHMKEM